MVTRHGFLWELHRLLQPRGYLEIGVQRGDSLRLVMEGTPAVGVDPVPLVDPATLAPGTQIYAMTSDEYFAVRAPGPDFFDLAFIDGMHLFEFALRDFMYIESQSNLRTVVVFDDVLPRNQGEAARTQCPGDWTGDVWKVSSILSTWRPDLTLRLVDTSPTGALVVWNLDPNNRVLHDRYGDLERIGLEQWEQVPDSILRRTDAHQAEDVLAEIREWKCDWR